MNDPKEKVLIFLRLFLYLISPLIFLIACIFTIIAIIYRQFVGVILSIKHGNKFGGILAPSDTVWTIENESKTVIICIMMIDYDDERQKVKSFDQMVFDIMFKCFFKNPDLVPKMNGTRHSFLGYPYLLKKTYTAYDCIRKIDENIDDEEDLRRYVTKISNQPLPKDHNAFWEIRSGTKSIYWHNKKKKLYPVVMRLSHVIGDGWSLINLLLTCFCDPEHRQHYLNNIVSMGPAQKSKKSVFEKILGAINGLVKLVVMIIIFPEVTLRQTLLKTPDKTEWNDKKISGEKVVVWQSEDTENLVPLCKQIRRKVENCKFVHIIFAIIGYSIAKHFQRHKYLPTDSICSFLTILLAVPPKKDIPAVTNNFSMCTYDVPTNPKKMMLQYLEELRNPTMTMKKTKDAQLNFWLMNGIVGLFPSPVLRTILDFYVQTISVTNLPMPFKLTTAGGSEIGDLLIFPPNWGKSGLTFSITSYANRFQATLIADKSMIPNQDEAQMLVDNILEGIRELDREVQ